MTSRLMPDIARMRNDATLIMDTPVAIARSAEVVTTKGGRTVTDTTVATIDAFVGAISNVDHPVEGGGAGVRQRFVYFPALTDIRVDDRLTIGGNRWRVAEVVSGLDFEVIRKVRAVSV